MKGNRAGWSKDMDIHGLQERDGYAQVLNAAIKVSYRRFAGYC
jgi:hypothetical protein